MTEPALVPAGAPPPKRPLPPMAKPVLGGLTLPKWRRDLLKVPNCCYDRECPHALGTSTLSYCEDEKRTLRAAGWRGSRASRPDQQAGEKRSRAEEEADRLAKAKKRRAERPCFKFEKGFCWGPCDFPHDAPATPLCRSVWDPKCKCLGGDACPYRHNRL